MVQYCSFSEQVTTRDDGYIQDLGSQWVADLVEQAVGETLLPALPLISRNHLVVVAAVQDPDVVRWAVTTPTDGAGAYRKAAAVQALDERRRTTARAARSW